jgi:hypothetical protein
MRPCLCFFGIVKDATLLHPSEVESDSTPYIHHVPQHGNQIRGRQRKQCLAGPGTEPRTSLPGGK